MNVAVVNKSDQLNWSKIIKNNVELNNEKKINNVKNENVDDLIKKWKIQYKCNGTL